MCCRQRFSIVFCFLLLVVSLATNAKPVTSEKNTSEKQQNFLNTVQYSKNGILRYERIFGDGFVSTGGLDTTKELVQKLNLSKGQKVLDIGCGIGGSAFYMAKNYGANVTGIDLSSNMIEIALNRQSLMDTGQGSVVFRVEDIMAANYPENSFDVIYSRDTLLHIKDKPALFKKMHQWLKPGGRLLISDYCLGDGKSSAEFKSYLKQRQYQLIHYQQYGNEIREAGFSDVTVDNRSQQFSQILKKEIQKLETYRSQFLQDFSQKDYKALLSGWQAKVKRVAKKQQQWAVFTAMKG